MSDFVTRLAQRQLGQLVTVEPRLPSRFAATAPAAQPSAVKETITVDDRRLVGARAEPPRFIAPASVSAEQQAASVAMRDGAAHAMREPAAATDMPRAVSERDDPAAAPPALPPSQPTIAPVSSAPFAAPSAHANALAPVSLPIATHGVARAVPSLDQAAGRAESGAAMPPPLVANNATIAASAPPRLEVKPPPRGESAAHSDADAETPIHVTIGRIEVTALTPGAPAKRSAAPRKPAMSLDDYLARRQRRQP